MKKLAKTDRINFFRNLEANQKAAGAQECQRTKPSRKKGKFH